MLAYTIVYAILLQHGYQGQSEVVGSATGRIEGSAFQVLDGEQIVWDSHDVGSFIRYHNAVKQLLALRSDLDDELAGREKF